MQAPSLFTTSPYNDLIEERIEQELNGHDKSTPE
ncbi:hypothetical protein swp_3988 [Shewanella piezotolerans WP3]|uniref:Uncharacterized protein n=1 Tax=Shewanella piezotolerans (strain WP3 / JCM 13877) TaxID=225849 RepID=B8CSN2_SHEPW|nr:hypothetical protein swp_3988 [Shewanella piezotolerans WP3]